MNYKPLVSLISSYLQLNGSTSDGCQLITINHTVVSSMEKVAISKTKYENCKCRCLTQIHLGSHTKCKRKIMF